MPSIAMRPLLVAVASNKTYLDDLDGQLRSLIGEYFNIVSMTCARYRSLSRHKERILFLSAPHVIDMVRDAIPEDCMVISPKRVINPQRLHRLLDIPPHSDVLVVNNTYANAVEIVNEMQLLGFGHLNLVAYQPFTVPDRDYHYAITADEPELVPPGIPVVINIGTRLLSLKSLDKLTSYSRELGDMLDNWIYERYAKFILHQADYMRQTGQEPTAAQALRAGQAAGPGDDKESDPAPEDAKEVAGAQAGHHPGEQVREHLRVILSTFDDGAVIVGEEGIISCANAKAVDLLGDDLEDSRLDEHGISVADLLKQSVFKVVGTRTLFIEAREVKATERPSWLVFIREIGQAAATQDAEAQPGSRSQKSRGVANRTLYTFADIVRQSQKMESLVRLAMRVARHDTTVLVTGESGTGKELVAQSLHSASMRKNGPFVAINCATLSEALLESELFGYEDGAFTGAKKGGKRGLFEVANKGTIFLDEVGDAPLATQVKLLRVLQEREVLRVGASKPIPVDVRVIAATNRNLLEDIARDRFRRDLYYRLNVITLHIPPLRERLEDVPLLLRHFMGRSWPDFPAESLDGLMGLLQSHSWPGNVRELRNLAEYLSVLGETSSSLEEDVARLFRSYAHAHSNGGQTQSRHVTRHGEISGADLELSYEPAPVAPRSAAEGVFFRKARMREELGHILSVFRAAEEQGELLGCGGVQKRLAMKGIVLSPQQVKTRMNKLKSMGLTMARTGSGTRLTEMGRKALAELDIPDCAERRGHGVA